MQVLKFEFLKFRILEILNFHPCSYCCFLNTERQDKDSSFTGPSARDFYSDDQSCYSMIINSAYWEILRAFLLSADLFQNQPFQKTKIRNTKSVKQFGSRSGPRFFWVLFGSKLFAKVISRWH